MTLAAGAVRLEGRFAKELPELAVPWAGEPAPAPRLLILNEALAVELGLKPDWLYTPEGIGLLTGTVIPEDATPVAQAYSGHQFGNLSPRLGDGRALLLGEIEGRDLHLKGSGRTPFARGGDGLAVVGPMLREYIISEAMHALGIPTTRSLAVVATGRAVQRETTQPGRCWRGWPPATYGWAVFSTPHSPAARTWCGGWPTTPSAGITPTRPPHPIPIWRCSTR